jgi:tRNA nucleotidyltransferase (CCA-adding enzyme)
VQFATRLQTHLNHVPIGSDDNDIRETPKVAVISANPEQSKHLETATMRVHGMDVDFCNLRSGEIYQEHSRIPTTSMTFGTPLEDALRRDFTINALFYNIESKQVEDWTGQGLMDLLERKRIVTPLEPVQTFHDDPLRVLRAIRFGVRLGLALHSSLQTAAVLPQVHDSLHLKVSRERVGKELMGMLCGKGAKPSQALDWVAHLKLAGSVFCVPPPNWNVQGTLLLGGHTCNPPQYVPYHVTDDPSHHVAAPLREAAWEESRRLLSCLDRTLESHTQMLREDPNNVVDLIHAKKKVVSVVDVKMLHLAVFVLPFQHLVGTEPKKPSHKQHTVVSYMIRDSLKYPNRDVQCMETLMKGVDSMRRILVGNGNDDNGNGNRRLEIGLLLRSLKETWVTCLLLATVAEFQLKQPQPPLVESSSVSSSVTQDAMVVEDEEEKILSQSRELYLAIQGELGLEACWTVPPLINGRELIQFLNLPKGPMVAYYLDRQVQWMLEFPHGTKDELKVFLTETMTARSMAYTSNSCRKPQLPNK